jgi:hypothetical protein
MSPLRAFGFSGEVVIVTGAGSRMDGNGHFWRFRKVYILICVCPDEIGNGRASAIHLLRYKALV